MRVLYIIDTLESGGSERSLLEIARRFRDTEPAVCHLYRGDHLKHEYMKAGVQVISLNLQGKYEWKKAVRMFGAVLRSVSPDLVHSALFRSGIVARIVTAFEKYPLVDSFVSDSYSPLRTQAMGTVRRMKSEGVRLVDRATARLAFHFTAVSETIKRSNCRALGIRQDKVTVIPRGRDPGNFYVPGGERVGSSQLPESVEGGPVLLNVARLLPGKGQQELIRAMVMIKREIPSAVLLVAGEGLSRHHLEALCRELGLQESVKMLGKRDDIPALLARSDLFVFPSHYEGLPGALVEAMLAARPIVAADTAVHRETLGDGAALYSQLHNPHSLAEAVISLLKDKEKAAKIAWQARKNALERYDIDKVSQRHEKFYRDICLRWSRRSGRQPFL